MKFTIVERFFNVYEVEADSFEEAKAIHENEARDGQMIFDELACITAEDGTERIYS